MKIDELDFEIVSYLLYNDGEPKTVCDIVRSTLNPKDDYEMIKQSNKLDYRCKRLEKDGILIESIKVNKKYYETNLDSIYYGEGILKIGDNTIDIGNAIVLELKDSRYYVAFIDNNIV